MDVKKHVACTGKEKNKPSDINFVLCTGSIVDFTSMCTEDKAIVLPRLLSRLKENSKSHHAFTLIKVIFQQSQHVCKTMKPEIKSERSCTVSFLYLT